jgi:hypothetical protein
MKMGEDRDQLVGLKIDSTVHGLEAKSHGSSSQSDIDQQESKD